jgi:hypothetical protein
MTISALGERCACGGIMPVAALRCVLCAHDRVANSMWWSEFLLSWKYIGVWRALNTQDVFAIGQRAQESAEEAEWLINS